MASGSARDWKWGSGDSVGSHHGVMRKESIYDVWWARVAKTLYWDITPFILELIAAVI